MTARLLIATRNEGKKREIKRILDDVDVEIVFPDEFDLVETDVEAELETTGSYEGNALAKATHFASLTGLPCAADDSGIEVDHLGGAPGVESRHFAGATGTAGQDRANNDKLLSELDGVGEQGRGATYRCVVVYVLGANGHLKFEGTCTGTILTVPEGNQGFGYDPLFRSADLGKSFGRATREEKDSVSHRGRAFKAFRDYLAGAGR